METRKKAIKVKFTDFWQGNPNFPALIMHILESAGLTVEISNDPDFLFYSTFGSEHLSYDCVRIFFTGEDAVPDFNICDYAIGFSQISFGDRYLRVPLYCFYRDDYKKAIDKHTNIDDSLVNRSFCNFIYSNPKANPERDEIFEALCKYKKVDSGGKYRNNIGEPVGDKLEFQKKYKFSIAFENSFSDGYTTEKILQAFAARTIPIYWGNPSVAKDFNEKAFVNCHNYASISEVVEQVKRIDNDQNLYLQMLREPIFNGEDLIQNRLSEFKNFIVDICSREATSARRRGNGTWNIHYNERMKWIYTTEAKIMEFESKKIVKVYKKFKRALRRN